MFYSSRSPREESLGRPLPVCAAEFFLPGTAPEASALLIKASLDAPPQNGVALGLNVSFRLLPC
jgi:hypothetical protein